jgi:hypothetical protein
MIIFKVPTATFKPNWKTNFTEHSPPWKAYSLSLIQEFFHINGSYIAVFERDYHLFLSSNITFIKPDIFSLFEIEKESSETRSVFEASYLKKKWIKQIITEIKEIFNIFLRLSKQMSAHVWADISLPIMDVLLSFRGQAASQAVS